MAPRKRQLQTRVSRSDRMRSATVKRARAAQPDDGRPAGGKRSGVELVGPSPAIDAVLAGQTFRYGRRAAIQIGWLVAIMALVALVVVLLAPQIDESSRVSLSVVDLLLFLAGLTGILGMLILFRLWRQRQTVVRLAPKQRRCTLSTGTLRVQERLTVDSSHEHWLRAAGSDWMMMDSQLRMDLEPIMEASQRNDLSFSRQAGNDVAREWIVRYASVLFHHDTRTVIEVHDSNGDLVYRHPRYRPNG